MEEGASRPEETGEQSPDETQDWYFDLPSGAWERQEEKNRQLRERVQSNLAEDSPRNDPFVLIRKEPEPKARGGRFGFGKKKQPEKPQDEQKQTLFGTFQLTPGAGDPPDGAGAANTDVDEWSTEPDVPLRPRLFAGQSTPPAAPAYLQPEESSGSKWGDTFGGPAAGGPPAAGSPDDEDETFSAMKSWAASGRQKPGPRAFALHRQEEEQPEDEPDALDVFRLNESPADDLTGDAADGDPFSETPRSSWAWSDHSGHGQDSPPAIAEGIEPEPEFEPEPEPEPAFEAEPAFDETDPATEETNHEFGPAEAPIAEAPLADAPIAEAPPADAPLAEAPTAVTFDKVPLRPIRPPEPPRETLATSGAGEDGSEPPTSKWDDMFEGAQEVSNIDAMREWLAKPLFAEPGDEPKEVPAELLQPFDWEQEAEPVEEHSSPEELAHRFAWKQDDAPAEPLSEVAATSEFRDQSSAEWDEAPAAAESATAEEASTVAQAEQPAGVPADWELAAQAGDEVRTNAPIADVTSSDATSSDATSSDVAPVDEPAADESRDHGSIFGSFAPATAEPMGWPSVDQRNAFDSTPAPATPDKEDAAPFAWPAASTPDAETNPDEPFAWQRQRAADERPSTGSIFGHFASDATGEASNAVQGGSAAPSQIGNFFARGRAADDDATAQETALDVEPPPELAPSEIASFDSFDEPELAPDNLFEWKRPGADAEATATGAEPEAPPSAIGRAPEAGPEKKGLIKKLFGRSKKAESAERDYSANTAWLEPTGTEGSDMRSARGDSPGVDWAPLTPAANEWDGPAERDGTEEQESVATPQDEAPSAWAWDNAGAGVAPEPLQRVDVRSNPWQADDEPATAEDELPSAATQISGGPSAVEADASSDEEWAWEPEDIGESARLSKDEEDGWDPEGWDTEVITASVAPTPPRPEPVPSARIVTEPQPVSADWWADVEAIERGGGSAAHLMVPPQADEATVVAAVPSLSAEYATAPPPPQTAYWADLRTIESGMPDSPKADTAGEPIPSTWWADVEAAEHAAGPGTEVATLLVDAAPVSPIETDQSGDEGSAAATPLETAYWADLRDGATATGVAAVVAGAAINEPPMTVSEPDDAGAPSSPLFAIAPASDAPMDDDPWGEVVGVDADDTPTSPADSLTSGRPAAEDDDPWAAFMKSRDTESEPPQEPTPDAPPASPAVAWRTAFAAETTVVPGTPEAAGRVADAALGTQASAAEHVTGAAEPDDDPWADFEVRSAGNESHAEEPPSSLEPTMEAFDTSGNDASLAIGEFSGFTAPPPGPDGSAAPEGHDPDLMLDLAASLESQVAEAGDDQSYEAPHHDLFAKPVGWAPSGFPRRPATMAPGAQPASPVEPGDAPEEGDVVLRAFERHAAEPENESADWDERMREPAPVAFDELLGDDADELVAEPRPDDGAQSFARLQGWAPQRSAARASNALDAPWAPEDGTLAGGVYAPGKVPGTALPDEVPPPPPPPWATEGAGGDGDAGALAASRVKQSRSKTLVRELVETGLLAILVFLAVRASFQNFKVDGTSMYPTLNNGQFLIVNKIVYSEINTKKLSSVLPFVSAGKDGKTAVFHGPERGDIVVLVDPRQPQTDLIKRVIGLPGETLEVADGHVYINDHLLIEPYIKTPWHDNKAKITIPEGEYFVMGDNRDNSLDSRSAQVGFIPADNIIGKAMVSYWPKSDIGLAPNGSPTLSPTVFAPTNAAAAQAGN